MERPEKLPSSGEREEVRLPPHCRFVGQRDDLAGSGWREALVSGGDHLQRALDEYLDLGFECALQEIDPSQVEGCAQCYKAEGERLFRVFVRSREKRREEDRP